jgi:hypothetical protein
MKNEFEYVGEFRYDNLVRFFWKNIKSKKICCYWAISNKHENNKEEMNIVHSEISDRISSVTFGKGCTKNSDPMWELVGVDEDGRPKTEQWSHSEMTERAKKSIIVDMPFNLGENFWERHGRIESTTPIGSELSSLNKKLF